MGKDVGEIRRVLQVFDQTANAPSARQAVGSLQGVTAAVGKDPDAFDLLEDPSEAEAWRSAGGEAHCENLDFPEKLAARWSEVLARPDFSNAGFDKDELSELKAALTKAFKALLDAGLELGSDDTLEELELKLDELIAAAPEASSSDDDSDDESDSDDED